MPKSPHWENPLTAHLRKSAYGPFGEIRLRPKTDTHDIDFKMKRAKQFLQHKDKVQVSVIFKGREMAHLQEGRKVMERAIEELMEVGKVESAPTQLGRRIVCTIAPK